MSLRDDVERELSAFYANRTVMPATLQAADPSGLAVRIELTAVDSMSCRFSELVLSVPSLMNSVFDVLKQWATDLSRRITYLLESIGPLEFDPTNGQVLIRSKSPSQLPTGSRYYEIVLSSSGSGSFVLRRYESVAGQPGRDPVDLQMTREVLAKLLDDLIATIPGVP